MHDITIKCAVLLLNAEGQRDGRPGVQDEGSPAPGLSCYWQIAPHRNQLSFDEWMALDVKYVKERSFLVDWRIIFRTFRAVLFGHGE